MFDVTATNSNLVDALWAQTGHGWLATDLELSLVTVVCALGARGRALVTAVASDT